MIIIRTLRKDIANYNKEDDIVGVWFWGQEWRVRGRADEEGSWLKTWVYHLFPCPCFALCPEHGRDSSVTCCHDTFGSLYGGRTLAQMSSELSDDCRRFHKRVP